MYVFCFLLLLFGFSCSVLFLVLLRHILVQLQSFFGQSQEQPGAVAGEKFWLCFVTRWGSAMAWGRVGGKRDSGLKKLDIGGGDSGWGR